MQVTSKCQFFNGKNNIDTNLKSIKYQKQGDKLKCKVVAELGVDRTNAELYGLTATSKTEPKAGLQAGLLNDRLFLKLEKYNCP